MGNDRSARTGRPRLSRIWPNPTHSSNLRYLKNRLEGGVRELPQILPIQKHSKRRRREGVLPGRLRSRSPGTHSTRAESECTGPQMVERHSTATYATGSGRNPFDSFVDAVLPVVSITEIKRHLVRLTHHSSLIEYRYSSIGGFDVKLKPASRNAALTRSFLDSVKLSWTFKLLRLLEYEGSSILIDFKSSASLLAES